MPETFAQNRVENSLALPSGGTFSVRKAPRNRNDNLSASVLRAVAIEACAYNFGTLLHATKSPVSSGRIGLLRRRIKPVTVIGNHQRHRLRRTFQIDGDLGSTGVAEGIRDRFRPMEYSSCRPMGSHRLPAPRSSR